MADSIGTKMLILFRGNTSSMSLQNLLYKWVWLQFLKSLSY